MNENENNAQDFNRRDFLKGGSVATLMTMLGGVQIFAQTNTPAQKGIAFVGPKIKVGVIGLGAWGREIVNTIAVSEAGEVAGICDTYAASLKRGSKEAPNAVQTNDYKTLLADKNIQAVVVATPTHKHKEIVVAALKAGKHVYCEAPLANTIEDAKEIAAAAKAAKELVFQSGLQIRCDPERPFLRKFVRAGALGPWVLARSQWHRKQMWQTTSPNPEREKELNWRLHKETSLGLIGEIGIHHVDQLAWFMGAQPVAVSAFGGIRKWDDGRDVADTAQAVFEFPGKVNLFCDLTLANSFDAEYEMFYGSDAAVMLRDGKAWMFKEVDSPNFGWEVYAHKDKFYEETGIALVADASKSVQQANVAPPPFTKTPLAQAMNVFLRNTDVFITKYKDAVESYGPDDKESIAGEMAKVEKLPAGGYIEGFQATVMVIKANEALAHGQRVEIKPETYTMA
jgi:predicted dehydrogenase